MWGRSQLAALASLVLAAGNRPVLLANGVVTKRAAGLSRAFASPYGRRDAWIALSYPRKDRMTTAAQHKRASKKARGIAKHRRHA